MSSLSRQYRPQVFADVTDQHSIKETLRLEIETGKLGNAYLFAGPRGVGKTTLARVFAKALNCLDVQKGEPCNACAACAAFNAGKCIDYIEMDAASNTGVDNVREAIIEHVRFAPNGNKFKIYTLDEAHMLSTNAWNALLKTIEEPPAYAKFIFITTELHKVPATIQSRCQRFDFKRVSHEAMAERVRTLAKDEHVTIDEEVVTTIASKADGCVRDAETFLGQMLSLGETHITADVASLVLPISRLPIAAQVLERWSQRELGKSLAIIQELDEQGVALLPLFDDLIEGIRQLLLSADSVAWNEKLSKGDGGERALSKLVGTFRADELSRIALVLMERRRDAKQGADVRFCLELVATVVALKLLTAVPAAPPLSQISLAMPTATSATVPSEGAKKINSAITPQQQQAPPSVNKQESVDADVLQKPAMTETASADVPTPVEVAATSDFTLSLVQRNWSPFLRALDEKSKSLVFVMKLVHPISVKGNVLLLEFQYAFHRDKALNDLKAKRMLEEIFRTVLNVPSVTLDGVIGSEHASAQEQRQENTVTSILKAFGGQVVEEGGATS